MANSNQNPNDNTVKLLIGAVVVGLIAALLSVLYLKAREKQLRDELTPKVEYSSVLVASQDILKGTKLDASVLSVRDVPASFVNINALTPDDFDGIEGKVIVQNLGEGNMVLKSFVDEKFPEDFSDTIPLKRRAMTIQVDEVNTISGFIRPGNKIDLLVNLPAGSTGETKKEGEMDSIFPVLENIEVLATGQDSAYEYEEKVRLLRGGINSDIDRNFTTLTINVTPKEAALVATAQDKGDLLALLRNRNDTSGSGFTAFSPKDLKAHAEKLAENARIREAAASAAGFVMGEDGVLRTKDGVALANQDLVVMADGTIMTKDGVVLSGRGLTVNEKGELVDANGNVVDPSELTVAADGSIITKDGVVLAGGKGLGLGKGRVSIVKPVVINGKVLEGVTRRADGKLVLADGTVVDADSIVVGADGIVRGKDGKVLAGVSSKGVMVNGKVLQGVTKRADGMLVLADGSVVDPADVVIGEDGQVRTKDGKLLAGVSATDLNDGATLKTTDGVVISGLNVNKDGKVVLADGTLVDPEDLVVSSDGKVYTKDGRLVDATVGVGIGGLKTDSNGNIVSSNGAVIHGAKLNKDGMLVLEDGTLVDPDDVVIGADGVIRTKDGKLLKGLTADTSAIPGLDVQAYSVDYIVGGVSEDGVAKVKEVPVVED